MKKCRARKTFAVGKPRADGKRLIQFFPLGEIETVDGETWTFTRQALEKIAARLNANGQELPVFSQHEIMNKPIGWVSEFYVDDTGFFGWVRWIDPEIVDEIKREEVKYTSPGFFVDEETGELHSVYEISTTNTPRIHGMRPLESAINTRPSPRTATKRKETSMDLSKIRALLGLADDASEEDALTALEARLNPPADQAEQITAAVQAAVADIKAATAAQVRSEFEARALAENHERQAVAMVEAAVKAGKVTVAQRADAESIARTNIEAFGRFIATAPRIAPVSARIVPSFDGSQADFKTADLTQPDTRQALAAAARKLVADGKVPSFTAAIESLTGGPN